MNEEKVKMLNIFLLGLCFCLVFTGFNSMGQNQVNRNDFLILSLHIFVKDTSETVNYLTFRYKKCFFTEITLDKIKILIHMTQ